MATYSAKESDITPKWYVVDLEGKTLGRAATKIATALRGKLNPKFTPHINGGDFVIAINADKIKLTGNKLTQKTYYHHSGYVGGIKSITAEKLLEKRPEDIITFAVKGMLPKNILGREQLKRLKVINGSEHPHSAQKPETLEI
jgi:large subunit ribosomal protein L13